ncbi:MAG: T9SS type A sorting domain-containing protein, partial [Candidatus Bipolaricaulia bacterium]
QADSTYNIDVRASDGQAASDTSFAVTVESAVDQPETIAIDINQSFGDATDSTNYRLVGLPGQVDLPIEETLEGEPGGSGDWRAFWDDGSPNDGLVEFDGSAQFNFRPGRGFWVLSKNNWTVQREVNTVALDGQNRASIPLHDGWNIISNPLSADVAWSDVQSANGNFSEPLWSFTGSFNQSNTFASAQTGEAYYFLNDAGLNSLQIPFPTGSGSSAAVAEKNADAQVLRLDALVGEETASSAWVGVRPNAKDGKDSFDYFAPPSHFTKASLSVANEKVESPHSLAGDLRPTGKEGHRYTLALKTKKADGNLKLRVNGLSTLANDQQVRLYNTDTGRRHDLQSSPTVDVKASGDKSTFALLLGSSSYVKEQGAEFVPDKLALRQNYPNPVQTRGQTTLEYSLPEQRDVSIRIYDVLGRRVRTLLDGKSQRAGVHTLRWDARNEQGQSVASGVYFARLKAGQTRTIKIVVID